MKKAFVGIIFFCSLTFAFGTQNFLAKAQESVDTVFGRVLTSAKPQALFELTTTRSADRVSLLFYVKTAEEGCGINYYTQQKASQLNALLVKTSQVFTNTPFVKIEKMLNMGIYQNTSILDTTMISIKIRITDKSKTIYFSIFELQGECSINFSITGKEFNTLQNLFSRAIKFLPNPK